MAEKSSPIPQFPEGLDEGTTYEPPEQLGRTVATNLTWKFTSQVIREGTRLVMAIVLARILTPGEWGLATMALVFAAMLQIVPDSVTVGLVQHSTITERDRSTVFWMALGLGVGMAVLGVAASDGVAQLFGEPQVADLFKAVSVGFVVTSLAVVPEGLLMRDLNYRSLELRHIAASIVGAIVALTLALAGAGPWAIIGNSLAGLTTSAILLWWFVRWRPRRTFSSASFRSFGSSGVKMLGSQVLTYAQLNADKLLVGRYLGAAAVGTYAFAFNLMFTPILNVAFPLQYVLFPTYATIQHDEERLRSAWLRGKRLTAAVLAPAFLTVLVVAPDLVRVVFGPSWENAIPVLQVLCIAGVAYALTTQNLILLLVRRRMTTLLRWSSFVTLVTIAAVVVGLPWGIVGVAASYATAQVLLVVPDMWITTRSASIRLRSALRAACTSLPFALAAAATAFLFRLALVEAGVPAAARIVLVVPVLLGLYAGLVWIAAPGLRREAADAIRHARGRSTD